MYVFAVLSFVFLGLIFAWGLVSAVGLRHAHCRFDFAMGYWGSVIVGLIIIMLFGLTGTVHVYMMQAPARGDLSEIYRIVRTLEFYARWLPISFAGWAVYSLTLYLISKRHLNKLKPF